MLQNYCVDRHSTAQYEGDLVTFVDIMSAKNNIVEYEGDVVTFVTNKTIENKNINYPPK